MTRITDRQIGCIWTLAAKAGMSRDEVYAMARVEHLHELTMDAGIQMIDVLRHMLGEPAGGQTRPGRPSRRELAMIDALRSKLGWSQERLQAFVAKRMGISHMRWLDQRTACKVIEALKAMLAGGRGERRRADDGGDPPVDAGA